MKTYSFCFWLFPLKIRLNGLVLRVKVSHVDNQILEDEHVTKRSDESWFRKIIVDLSDTGQSMKTITVHGTGSANSFSAWSSESESWIKIILDIDKCVKVHGWDFLEIDIVADVFGLIIGILGIVFIDEKSFHGGFLFWGERGIMLYDVVGVEISFDGGGDALEEDVGLISRLQFWCGREISSSDGETWP